MSAESNTPVWLTVLISIVTALLSGALVAFLNSVFQQMKEEKKLYREKAEHAFSAMNRIVASHSIIGHELYSLSDHEDAKKFLQSYDVYGPICEKIFLDDGEVNTIISVYFRDCLEAQQAISSDIRELCYDAVVEAEAMSRLGVDEIARQKTQRMKEVEDRYSSFNSKAEELNAQLLACLAKIERKNSLW